MPIKFPVSPGTILICDYSRGGFREPEMVKRRPAIVVSHRLPYRDKLCTVVPLSTTPPPASLDYVVELRLNPPLPEPFASEVSWAKCDMVATVSFHRLDLFRTERLLGGRRRYIQPKLAADDFTRVQNGILIALGISPHPP